MRKEKLFILNILNKSYNLLSKIKRFVIKNNFIFHTVIEYWGTSIFIFTKDGKGMCRSYWINDGADGKIYIDWLSVDNDVRNCGIGGLLMKMHEIIAKDRNMTTSSLCVKRKEWMYEWYKRIGYVDGIVDEHDESYINMIKQLEIT